MSGSLILLSCMFNGGASLYLDFELFLYEACSPRVDPLSSWLWKGEVTLKRSFKSAENRRARSLWVAAHRYTSISCASKLLWVYGFRAIWSWKKLSSEFSFHRNLLRNLILEKTSQFFSGPGVYLSQKLIWYDWRPICILSFELIKYLGSKLLWV